MLSGEIDLETAVGVLKIDIDKQVVSEKNPCSLMEDGLMHLKLVSDGRTGLEWIEKFEQENYHFDDDVRQLILSEKFMPTKGVITEIVLFNGKCFEENERNFENVRAVARRMNFIECTIEQACLIRESLSIRNFFDLGLWWVDVMLEPNKYKNGDYVVLRLSYWGSRRTLYIGSVLKKDDRCGSEHGLAFKVVEVET